MYNLSSIFLLISEEKMIENVDGWPDETTTDGRTDARVIGILTAHLGDFGSGELERSFKHKFLIQYLIKFLVNNIHALYTPSKI